MQNTYEVTNTFTILGKVISRLTKPYIIAEACINHEGKIALAKKMIDEAVRAGVSAIKFQFHVLDDEMLKQTPKSSNFSETLFDTLNRTNLSINEHKYLKSYCEEKKIDYLCTPFSFKSADILEKELIPNLKPANMEEHSFAITYCKKKKANNNFNRYVNHERS